MFSILEKLLVFILEGAKPMPPGEEEVSTHQQSAKKRTMVVSIVGIVIFGIGYTWYEGYVKGDAKIAKIKESQSKQVIFELRQANQRIKEERIILSAEAKKLTDKNTELLRERDKLRLELSTALANNLESEESNRRLIETQRTLEHEIEKLRLQIDSYVKDNRLIWDEIVTLGKEEGT